MGGEKPASWYSSLEIKVFDGDAKTACENDSWCTGIMKNAPAAIYFKDNAMISLYAQEEGVLDALIADIED